MSEPLVNLAVVRPGRRPKQLLFDVDSRTARAFLTRAAAAHTVGVSIVLERDRLIVESPTTGTTIYTISPADSPAEPGPLATAGAQRSDGGGW